MGRTIKQDTVAQIRTLAYDLWQQEGHPHGRDVDHWLVAEAQVKKGSTGANSGTARRTTRSGTAQSKTAANGKTATKKAPTSKATSRKGTKKTTRRKASDG